MDPRISRLIDSLPTLTKDDVDIHDTCPICFVDFKTILEDHNVSESQGTQGLTKIIGCSHVFCRKDLVEWICSWHGSCPTCRHVFLSNLCPESDDESDGGEYDPNEQEDFEDDDEDEDFSFEDEPGESLEDEEFEEFEEEDDHAMGLEITDDVGWSTETAAAAHEAYMEGQVRTVEDDVASIEAVLQRFDFEETEYLIQVALAEEEEARRREEAEVNECIEEALAEEEDACRREIEEALAEEEEARIRELAEAAECYEAALAEEEEIRRRAEDEYTGPPDWDLDLRFCIARRSVVSVGEGAYDSDD